MNLRQVIKREFIKTKKKSNICRLHESTFTHEEIYSATKSLLSGKITMGKTVKAFEDAYAKKYGFKYAIMVNSGSSANLLAISALCSPHTTNRLKKGDEVIVPSLSWSTTVWPLVQNGLVPVVADINPKTLNIDVKNIKKLISNKTRAIMIVPVYGNPCNMTEIVKLAKSNNLTLIEDTCESMNAYYKNKPLGSFGRVATFSTYFSHHISTLEGGLCVTNDKKLYETMIIQRSHGWLRDIKDLSDWKKFVNFYDKRFVFVDTGYNLRATELQASIGLIQLKKLNKFVNKRIYNAKWLEKNLINEIGHNVRFQKTQEKGKHSYFGFIIILKENCNLQVPKIRKKLTMNNIESRPIICGDICNQPAFKFIKHRSANNKVAKYIMDRAFSIGIHQDLSSKDLEKIKNCLIKILK